MFEMQALIQEFLLRVRVIEIVGDDVSRYDLDWAANQPAPYQP
jgi:hypothetical protein